MLYAVSQGDQAGHRGSAHVSGSMARSSWSSQVDGMRAPMRSRVRFERRWGAAADGEAVLLGPNIYVATPYFKWPNPTMKNKADWTAVGPGGLPPDALPIRVKFASDEPRTQRSRSYHWRPVEASSLQSETTSEWHGARRAANTGERTLHCRHHSSWRDSRSTDVASCAPERERRRYRTLSGVASSLLADFAVRVGSQG